MRSGLTTCSNIVSSAILCVEAARLFDGVFDGSDEIERLLRQIVVLSGHDFLEAADRIGQFHVFAREAGELFRDEERLRQEALDFTGARDQKLVFFAEPADTENRDNVLQILVTLQNTLDLL